MKRRLKTRKEATALLARKLTPFLEERTFKGSFRKSDEEAPGFFTWRRMYAENVHLLTFQFDKYRRARFKCCLGVGPLGGIYDFEDHVPASKLNPYRLSESITFTPRRGGWTSGWFRFDRLLHMFTGPEHEISLFMKLFTEVEDFFDNGTLSKHMIRLKR